MQARAQGEGQPKEATDAKELEVAAQVSSDAAFQQPDSPAVIQVEVSVQEQNSGAIRDDKNPEVSVSEDRIQYFKTNEKILTLRSTCANYKTEAKKLKEIADLDAKFTVPVIVNILIQIRESLIEEMKVNSSPQYDYNLNLLNRAIIIFATTDEVQNYESDTAKLGYIGKMLAKADADYDKAEKAFKDAEKKLNEASEADKKVLQAERDDAEALMKKYANPFHEVEKLATDSSGVTPTAKTLALWEELAIWMEGLYRRPPKRIPPVKKKKTG